MDRKNNNKKIKNNTLTIIMIVVVVLLIIIGLIFLLSKSIRISFKKFVEDNFSKKSNVSMSLRNRMRTTSNEIKLPEDIVKFLKEIENKICGTNTIDWSRNIKDIITLPGKNLRGPYIGLKFLSLANLINNDQNISKQDKEEILAILGLLTISITAMMEQKSLLEVDQNTNKITYIDQDFAVHSFTPMGIVVGSTIEDLKQAMIKTITGSELKQKLGNYFTKENTCQIGI